MALGSHDVSAFSGSRQRGREHMAPGTLGGSAGRSADQPDTGAGSGDSDITELLSDGCIGTEDIRCHEDLPETAALTAMHRQNRRRAKGSEGITTKEITPPEGPTVFLACITRSSSRRASLPTGGWSLKQSSISPADT